MFESYQAALGVGLAILTVLGVVVAGWAVWYWGSAAAIVLMRRLRK